VASATVVEVEVDVVGVRLPVEHEASRWSLVELDATRRQCRDHAGLGRGLGSYPRRADECQVLTQDALDAFEAVAEVAAVERAQQGLERFRAIALLEQCIRQGAGSTRLVGALVDGLAVGVHHQRARDWARRQALQPRSRHASQIGARGEQIDQRAVRSSSSLELTLRFQRLTQCDDAHHVTWIFAVRRARSRQGESAVPSPQGSQHLAERAGIRIVERRRGDLDRCAGCDRTRSH
jgi:hypothetical protein